MEDKIKNIIRGNLHLIGEVLREEGIKINDSEADFIDDENVEDAVDAIYTLYARHLDGGQ